jgi:hypothetical protein
MTLAHTSTRYKYSCWGEQASISCLSVNFSKLQVCGIYRLVLYTHAQPDINRSGEEQFSLVPFHKLSKIQVCSIDHVLFYTCL